MSNSDSILLNHKKVSFRSISKILEEEALELLNRFKNERMEKTPNVGFQLIYERREDIDAKKIAVIVCSLVESINHVKKEFKENSEFEQENIDKLIQPKFFLIKLKRL